MNGQDVVIFAPRRYGKSSLVWRTMRGLAAEDVHVAYVNLMTTPTKERLAEKLAAAIYEQHRLAARAGAGGGAAARSAACGSARR